MFVWYTVSMAKKKTPIKKTKRRAHVTETIAIKEAKVDKKMVPIVRWLNSFHSVLTMGCCQGSEDEQPYVNFICTYNEERDTILRIISCMSCHINVEIESGSALTYCQPLYRMRFDDQESFAAFSKYVLDPNRVRILNVTV